MKKAIFLIFQSLVLSRLLYGCAGWAEVPSRALQRIEAAVTSFYRQICNVGFWQTNRTTDKDILQERGLMSFRLHWAKQRLAFLHHIAQHGQVYHKALLLAEIAAGKGWLVEVCDDLAWLSSLKQLPFDIPTDRAGWFDAWNALRASKPWKAWLKTAMKKHLEQERIACQIRFHHGQICGELERAGMQMFVPDEQVELPAAQYRCEFCSAHFPTAQQLAVHAFRLHGIRAEECYYVQSEVCPGCLKTFHTSYRVIQHLRSRPKRCWDRIYTVKRPDDPVDIALPEHLKGVHRLPAVRRHHGPLRPTTFHRNRQCIRKALADLHDEGDPDFAWWDPRSDRGLTLHGFQLFEQSLAEWYHSAEPTEAAFHNIFLDSS